MSGLPISNRAATAGAILLGLAIPSLIAGRVPIAVAIALGSLLLAGPAHVRAALAATPELLRQPVAVATGATLTLWLVSAAIAGEAWALQVWAYVAGFLVLACYLYRRLRDDRALRIVFFKTMVVGGLISVTLAALSVLVWWEFLNPLRTSHVTSFYEAQQKLLSYGSVLPILSVAAIHAGWRLGRRWLAASLLVLPMGAGILLETGATAGWLGYLSAAAAIGIGWVLSRMRPWPARGTAAVLLVAAAAAAGWVVSNLPPIPYHCEETAIPSWALDAHRQVIWSFSVEHAVERPWLGWGLDSGGAVPGAKEIVPCFGTVEYVPSHSHNWMIELFLETGALGLGAAVIALLLYAAHLVRALPAGGAAAVAALGAAGAFWGSGLANFSIWSAWWHWCFLLPTAVLWGEIWQRRQGGRR